MHNDSLSIVSQFAKVVSQYGERAAIRATGGHWSYEELDRRSDFVATKILQQLGDGPEPVALLMAHDAPLIASILGALKANKMYVALDPSHLPVQIAAMLAASDVRLLLVDQANLALAKSIASDAVQIILPLEEFTVGLPLQTFPQVTGDAAAWLMFTSGSTGNPKGVWQNHAGLVNEAGVYAELVQITPDDRVSLLAACGLSASGATLFGTLLAGATLCLFHLRSQGADKLANWLQQERVTVFHTVPGIFRHLCQLIGVSAAFTSMRLVRLGGEALLGSDVKLFHKFCPQDCLLVQSYSSTETGMVSTHRLDQNTIVEGLRVPVGRAVSGVDLFLVDERNRPLKNGDEGRIAIRSRRLRQGYWHQPELTADIFLADAEDPALRTFVSNDIGKFRPDGTLEHLGRADRLVKILGQRVGLSEVEAALLATDLIQETAVVATDDATTTQRLVAYVVPRPGKTVSPRQLAQELRRQLPNYMVPAHFVPLKKLPQTPGGKVDRRALPALSDPDKRVLDRHEGPKGSLENRLARIWETVLQVSPISRFDDFYELGGTSLQSVEVLFHIEEALGVPLSPSTLAEYGTIEKLAALLSDQGFMSSPTLSITLRNDSAGRPLFLIHSGQGDVALFGLLTRQLSGRPVYGLQSPGLQGECWPYMSVPAMARRYLPEIIARDPDGPYFLGGACMGGLVALELAKLLIDQGRTVAMVALMDTALPIQRLRQPGFKEKFYCPVRDFTRDALRILRWGILRASGLGKTKRFLSGYRRFVANMNFLANRRYRPLPYPGTLTLILSTESRFNGEDRRLQMRQYARSTKIIAIPATHNGLYTRPAVIDLARELQNAMERAEARCAQQTAASISR